MVGAVTGILVRASSLLFDSNRLSMIVAPVWSPVMTYLPKLSVIRGDVTPFFRSESYESRLAASVSWQEDCEHHDEEEEKAFA